MAKYFFSNKAIEDISLIWDYTYKKWSENQADKYYKTLIETCLQISKSPKKGRYYDMISIEILGFKVNKHIIFYRLINAEGNEIEILRILHERMDLKSRIEELI